MREAVNGNTVYAVFDRFTNQISNDPSVGRLLDSQVVVVKSVNAGDDGFTALGADGNGVVVAAPMTGFTQLANTALSIGANRSGAGSAIAVNPGNPNDVVVAFSSVTKAGVIQVVVDESMNGGMTWTQKFMSPDATRSGQTQLAILDNGAIGVLYNSFSTNKLSVHLVTTTNDFATTTDTTLATQINPNPSTGQPYLGDYNGLVAVGNTFEGVFSALNADNGTTALIDPSNPASVIFQRDTKGTPGMASFELTNAAGTPVASSIDPFFFKFTPPVNPAPLIGVAQTPLDHALV